MLDGGCTVDETLFVQILHAYSVRNPTELILDDAYEACLLRMGGDVEEKGNEGEMTHSGNALQQRFGAKLFVRERDDGERILVAGTKKRNLELIPLGRVYSTLRELTAQQHQNATHLKQTVKGRVLGIPEEIVQEYCDMAMSSEMMVDETYGSREKEDFKKCSLCGVMKSHKSFTKHKEKPMGLRSRCKACEAKARQEKKDRFDDASDGVAIEEENLVSTPTTMTKKQKKKEMYMGLSGTAICAACGERKPVFEFDKARQKPFTLKCRDCTVAEAPLMSKRCCSCQLELSLDHFYRDSYTKAGFRPRCMDCMKAQKGTYISFAEPSPFEEDNKLTDNPEPVDTSQENNEPYLASKRARSRRSRRKTQKSKEAAVAVAVLEDPTEPLPNVPPVRHATREKRRRQRRKRTHLPPSDSPHPDSLTGVKIGTLNAFSLRALDTDNTKPQETTEPPEEVIKTPSGRARGLTGCSTVRDNQGNVTKYCTGCQHFKKANEFGRDVSKPSGLRSRCRQCQKRGRDVTSTGGSGGGEDGKPGGETIRKKIPRKPLKKKSALVEKLCARCDHQKPISEFYRDKSKDDSYAAICKKCAKEAKQRSEKAAAGKQNAFSKARQGNVNNVDDADVELVMNYVDALQPESSAFSADAGDEEMFGEEEVTMAQHRVCVGCKVDKNWIEFDPNPMLPDGLCPLCKECCRGNGMRGKRLSNKQLKRCCLRCGISKPAIQFAKSIFFPNRTSRICERCRNEDHPDLDNYTMADLKRRRLEVDHDEATNLMDFESDSVRARDPGGGERLWRCYVSETESDGHEKLNDEASVIRFKTDVMKTHLKVDGPKEVTITHHVPAVRSIIRPPTDQSEAQMLSPGFVWNGMVPKKGNMTYLVEKQCKRCGQTKNRDSYYVDDTQPSRLNANCIECCMTATEMAC